MQAWFARHYGGPEVLRLEQAPVPAIKPDQILVRILATTVNSGDVRVRGCDFPAGTKLMGRLALGWNGPRQPILGTEYAGVIESIGSGVTRFHKGDAVYAFSGLTMRAHAQYAAIAENGPVALLPAGLDFHQASALCFGGTTALHYLRQAGLKPGDDILVLGASGAVGLALVQLAKHQGARITASTSAGNAELVFRHGADRVIDYHSTDIAGLTDRFDIIADAVGATNFADAQNLLRPDGRYLAIAGALKEMLGAMRKGREGRRMIAGPAAERAEDVIELGRLAAAGHYRPHIDKVFDWSELPAAHAYVETGRKRGSVVVSVGE
ncbi:MAG: hypothetical protein ABS75_12065 [Pelagibacterium sp. SCN 63-23]|nr:MAG: hypothetical protein ABS75_12065 [Pelagibacterium sp. SCN 63-23]